MGFRVSTFSSYRRVLFGLRRNQLDNARAQEQLSSGLRILRPSDDPTGSARAIRFERQIADVDRYRRAIIQGTATVNAGAAALTSASSLMVQARELLIQGMNGTLTGKDRESIAAEFDLIRTQLLEEANVKAGDLYVFGGTASGEEPFVVTDANGEQRVVYSGTQEDQSIQAGESIEIPITLAGDSAFAKFEPTGTYFGGVHGVTGGTTADQGTGFATLTLRHDSTNPGNLASVGIGLVAGGASDTVLGDNTIQIDATAGTIQLGSGAPVPLPAAGTTDFVIENEQGGELHLDMSGYTGADYSGIVRGEGSIALDGKTFTPLSFTETNLELKDDPQGRIVHVNATGVKSAGNESVEFGGTANVFDLMGQIADDLRNEDGLSSSDLISRLNRRLEELDRHHSNILVAAGTLGARSQRLQISDERTANVEVRLQGLLSDVRDADLAEVSLDLTRSNYLLQLTQSAGSQLIQSSLLNFLG
ncbi:MAG TPA: flagellar hook-associated protein 3 [Planctomycetes bacterium]|nr:flagellar hook-associated protein 3 [Planctomycetota bacterium]